MIEVQCPSTLKIKQLNNRSLVCQQLDIQRVSNLLAMIQHVGLFSEFLLKQGIHNSLCAPTWAHGRTLLYLWYKDMGFQWCWFWLPLLILHYYGVCHKKKEKRFNINAKIPGCSTVSRGGTEYVCAFLAILTYNTMPDTARGSEFKVQCYGTVCPSCVHTTCNTMYFSKVHFGRQESFLAFGDY